MVSYVAGSHGEVTQNFKYRRAQVIILPLALAGSFTATSTFRVSFESSVASTKTLSESKSDLKKKLIGSCLSLV